MVRNYLQDHMSFVVNVAFFYFSRGKFNIVWELSEKLV